jgi:CBS domain-containing protein
VINAINVAKSVCSNNPRFVQRINTEGLVDDFEFEHGLIHDSEKKCFYPLKTLFSASPDDVIKFIYVRGVYTMFPLAKLAIFLSFYSLVTVFTYGIMMPTDLVIPSITIGATFGRVFGVLMNLLRINLGLVPIDPGVLALVGSMAFWAGSSQMLLTVILVAIEATLNLDILPAMSLTLLIAVLVSKMIGESLYHREIHLLNIPYLPHEGDRLLEHVTAKDLITTDYRSIGTTITLDEIRSLLSNKDHFGFPVMKMSDKEREILTEDERKHLRPIGIILRSQLKFLIDKYAKDEEHTGVFYVEDIMTSPPLTVDEDTIGAKVFDIFRREGLRHLIVVNFDGDMAGIITRQSLLHEMHDEGRNDHLDSGNALAQLEDANLTRPSQQ